MRRLRFTGPLALLAAAALADEIDVGGTHLSIPAPEGYATVTDGMQPYADIAKRFVPPQNQQFAIFLSEEDVALAAEGSVPEPTRFFYVQTARSIVHRVATIDNFAEVKSATKAQNSRIAKEIEAKAPGVLEQINEGITKDYDVDLALSLSQVLPFPPHHESDRSLAFSMITKYEMTGADGNPVGWEAAVTATFVHVKGKILFLYAVGEKADLAWTRDASRDWAAVIVAANPSTGSIAADERRPSRRGFDWGEVLKYAAIGAVVGGILGAYRQLGKKKKR